MKTRVVSDILWIIVDHYLALTFTCSKSTIEAQEKDMKKCLTLTIISVSIVNFEQVNLLDPGDMW